MNTLLLSFLVAAIPLGAAIPLEAATPLEAAIPLEAATPLEAAIPLEAATPLVAAIPLHSLNNRTGRNDCVADPKMELHRSMSTQIEGIGMLYRLVSVLLRK